MRAKYLIKEYERTLAGLRSMDPEAEVSVLGPGSYMQIGEFKIASRTRRGRRDFLIGQDVHVEKRRGPNRPYRQRPDRQDRTR